MAWTWNNIMNSVVFYTVAAVCVCSLAFAAPASDHRYNLAPYQHNEHLCYPCPAGHHVKDHCEKAFTNSTCVQCEPGHYMNETNKQTYCLKCPTAACEKNSILVQNCTSTTNQKCQCEEGTWNSHNDNIDDQIYCLPHTLCKKGEGIVVPGNHEHDRKCRKCIVTPDTNQEFVNASDPHNPRCQPCSTCPGVCTVRRSHQAPHTLVVCNSTANGSFEATTLGTTIGTRTQRPRNTTKKGKESAHGVDGGIMSLIVFLLMAALFGIGVIILQRKKRCTKNRRHTREDGPTNEQVPLQIVSSPTSHQADGTMSANGAVPANGYLPASGSRSSGHQAAAVSSVADSGVFWDEESIEKRAFPFIAANVGFEWKTLIRQLPGISPDEAQNCIEYAQMNNPHNAKEQISEALREWKNKCIDRDKNVTKAGILKALGDARLNDVKLELVKAMEKDASAAES